jgi:hypothetical protein
LNGEKSLPPERYRYFLLLKSLDHVCDKSVVARLPNSTPQKPFAVLGLRDFRLTLPPERTSGVL